MAIMTSNTLNTLRYRGICAQIQSRKSHAARSCTNNEWIIPSTIIMSYILIPRKSLYITKRTLSFIESTTWKTRIEGAITQRNHIIWNAVGWKKQTRMKSKLEFDFCLLHRCAGTEWSFCRFTYKNLVTTSPSSEYHGLPIVPWPAKMLVQIWTVSQVTVLVGATGGVYKRQGLVRHEVMTLVYLEFLVYRPKFQERSPVIQNRSTFCITTSR